MVVTRASVTIRTKSPGKREISTADFERDGIDGGGGARVRDDVFILLMFAVGALRPALVVMHGVYERETPRGETKAFGIVFRFLYKPVGARCLTSAGVRVYNHRSDAVRTRISCCLPIAWCYGKFYYGSAVTASGISRHRCRRSQRRMYGSREPRDLIPGHVYDRESAALIWGLRVCADSPRRSASHRASNNRRERCGSRYLGLVVLRDTIANFSEV